MFMSDYSSTRWFSMTRFQLSDHLRVLSEQLGAAEIPAGRPITRIDNWALARRAVPCLVGIPTSHPILPDEEPIFTSELFYLDPEKHAARTFSRWYELGKRAEPGFWDERCWRPL
ncbi:DUF6634 family protein [Hoeflea sp.]|uniref:DUF6634 family protein n=1 Tax=Hoeflea sp. TaxID=1940281 RepID=UPI003BAE784A